MVNQEAQQEVQFPEVLHCVFCGAKGLFMDCLTKNTSAHVVVSDKIMHYFMFRYQYFVLLSQEISKHP